ncbi:hypothetical protein CFB89_00685 [Burkholderia sp. AU16741]|nr:hypothetical protein CFB89_00685 [Burkholderia sp. AU16741]
MICPAHKMTDRSSATASALTAACSAACIDACKATHSLKEDAGLLVPEAQTGPVENVLLYSPSYGLFPFRDNSVERFPKLVELQIFQFPCGAAHTLLPGIHELLVQRGRERTQKFGRDVQ